MTNPTSNFNWIMPEPTSLVTDLPADFEVFGQAVDTDLADLLGGTTGQVLSKTSATDLAFTWIDNDQGDITGVTAGTGITVTDPTGPVPTVTNSMATEIDAKGDLIIGTGADTFSRLALGTNNYVLTADSAEATGVKWAAPAGDPGLTLIDEIAVSSSASTTVNDVFSSTYKNYKIMLVGASTGASSSEVTMRLRVSGTDTTANYAAQEIYSFSTTLAGRSNLFGTDEWYMGDLGTSTTGGVVSFDLTSPNLADRTSYVCNAANGGSTLKITGGAQTDTTQFTGFTLNYAQTTTGSIFVYGYAKE
jgi:hypothetical protein